MRSPGAPSLAAAFAAVVAFAAALLLPWNGATIHANGVPTVIQLAYIEGLSTWGPETATGEVEISFAESYARLSADGLPLLGPSRLYQAWIVNSESSDAITVGRFAADADGRASYEGVMPPIDEFGFDLFLITVEPEPDNGPQPTSDRSIGGYFSLIGPDRDDPTNADDVTGTVLRQGGLQPTELPATGDATSATEIARVSALAAVLFASVVAAIQLSRNRAARSER